MRIKAKRYCPAVNKKPLLTVPFLRVKKYLYLNGGLESRLFLFPTMKNSILVLFGGSGR
jgi:hypothetical protein